MIKCKENYIGRKYNHLKIIKQIDDYISPKNKHEARFLCECDCNPNNPNFIEVVLCHLKNGSIKSCGCVRKENSSKFCKKIKAKPMENNPTLELNLTDNKHSDYGRCKTSNTDKWFYFSMLDYDYIKKYCWHEKIGKDGYSRLEAKVNGKVISMHKLFGMNNPDHINRNPLDNRRENLDIQATKTIQCQNRGLPKSNKSGCKGVRWDNSKNRWQAYIGIDCKLVHIGYFINKRDAIISRLKAEQCYFTKRAWQIDLMKKYNLLNNGGI